MDTPISYWPLMVLLLGIASVVLLIAVLRIHAFIALVISAVVVGLLSSSLPGDGNHLIKAVELSMTELGVVAGKIAVVIALASILGVAMTDSGAAERIVIQFLRAFGEKLAPVALLLGAFILSIPVFFDTVFFLLIPLAYSMGRHQPQKYLFYVLAVCIGGALTHSLVPPTPGPLIMAETMSLNLGLVIVAGIVATILPAIISFWYARRINKAMVVPVPDMSATGEKIEEQKEENLPPFGLSMLPIIVPLLLIILSSVLELVGSKDAPSLFEQFLGFIGNKNVAMFIGTMIALWILARQKGWGMNEMSKAMEKPLEIAGVIILITSAGGAFGAMIRHSGIGTMIEQMADRGIQLNYVLLAWLIAGVMKLAQGSSTVAMITAAGIMMAIMGNMETMPFHPIYLFLAMGFGSLALSWMNDSGFWVVSKLGGMNEKQMLQTWTVVLSIISVVGLIEVLLFSYLFPMV